MIKETLRDQQYIGRRIAQALEPLGLTRDEIQDMVGASVSAHEGKHLTSQDLLARAERAEATHNVMRLLRMAGAAAYFEGKDG